MVWHDHEGSTSADAGKSFYVHVSASICAGGHARTIFASGSGEDAAKRWLSCLLLTAMPSMGMQEAVNELTSLHRFYTQQDVIERARGDEAEMPRVPVTVTRKEESASIAFDD